MKAEIISIGTELTTGSILNTNSYFISKELLKIGIETVYQTTVDDNKERLKEVLDIAVKRSDLIITTGGLGPTQDDLTKETIAEFFKLKIIRDPNMEKIIKEKLNKYGKIPKNNFKQADIIESGEFLDNEFGTAPGIYLEIESKVVVLLPGPPREMEAIFLKKLVPRLRTNGHNIITKSVNLVGLGEAYVESEILDIKNIYENVEIATFGNINSVEIKIIARGYEKSQLLKQIESILNHINIKFSNYIYAYDNKPIENIVSNMLKERNLKISFAESCTGGLLSGYFIRQPGISSVFDRGFITYSNEAKNQELMVHNNTLSTFGAVSKETSLEMVKGLLTRKETDIAVSITGIAGPNSDNSEKPVGLVYISIGNSEIITTKKVNYSGSRKNIQNKVILYTLFQIREFLLNNY